jgi:hypothetical protein
VYQHQAKKSSREVVMATTEMSSANQMKKINYNEGKSSQSKNKKG